MSKRTINVDLVNFVKDLPCIACGKPGGDAHHVTSVGAGGDDEARNLMPLCRTHHTEWHKSGPGKMVSKYPGCNIWLLAAGREDVFEKIKRK